LVAAAERRHGHTRALPCPRLSDRGFARTGARTRHQIVLCSQRLSLSKQLPLRQASESDLRAVRQGRGRARGLASVTPRTRFSPAPLDGRGNVP